MEKENLIKRIKANDRKIIPLGEFDKDNLPVIGLTSENWRTGEKQIDITIDFRDVCSHLQDGKIFVIGRDKDCNLRPRYQD